MENPPENKEDSSKYRAVAIPIYCGDDPRKLAEADELRRSLRASVASATNDDKK